MSISPDRIDVYQDIQENYIIYDREITENPDPKFNNNLLVTNDHLSNRLYFNMWYTFDDRDLESKEVSIVWVNANNEKGLSLCIDKELKDNDRLTFAWNVPHQATYKDGIVKFAVRIIANDYVWNSLISTVEVKKGLITEEFNNLREAQLSPGWADYIQGKYKISIQKLTESEYTALETKDSETVYIVLKDDNTVEQYIGDRLISGGTSPTPEPSGNEIISYGVIDGPNEYLEFEDDPRGTSSVTTHYVKVVAKSGIKYRCPNGLDSQGKFLFTEHEIIESVSQDRLGYPETHYVALTTDGEINANIVNYFVVSDLSAFTNRTVHFDGFGASIIIYNYKENKTYRGYKKNSSDTMYTIEEYPCTIIARFVITYTDSKPNYYYTASQKYFYKKSPLFINSDDIIKLLDSKPGMVVPNMDILTTRGTAPSHNCVLWNDNLTGEVCGTYNNLFGEKNTLIGGRNNTVFGSDNVILANAGADTTHPQCNLISGIENSLINTDSMGSLMVGRGLYMEIPSNSSYNTVIALGRYNLKETNIFVVGNGTSDSSRSNAIAVDTNGNFHIYKDATMHTGSTTYSLLDKIQSLESRIATLEG